MIRITVPLIGAAALLAACTPHAPIGETNPPAPVPGVACNASKVKALVGQSRSDLIEAEAIRLTGANMVRWIMPGSAVTKDFRIDRLNLNLDDSGKILSGGCG